MADPLLLLAPLAHADVLMVEGEVLASEPVFETRWTEVVPAHCRAIAPSDFGGLLRWDIDCKEVKEEAVLMGYDVRYRFRNREFMSRMAEKPGKTIPLQLSFD